MSNLKTLELLERAEAIEEKTDPLAWKYRCIMTEEQLNELSDPNWIYKNLVIESHIIAIVAEPNAGKTALMQFIAAEMAASGFDVNYVNVDIAGSDARPAAEYAKANNYNLLLPDHINGMSIEWVIKQLAGLAEMDIDLSGQVWIFDTLKKMTDVINKKQSKELYKLFRALSAKNMTIIVLAHTNKYKDSDGKPIYEGTGDLRSDFDELIYLIPQHHDDKSITISTEPDKVRGAFDAMSFFMNPDRSIKPLDQYVNVIEQRKINVDVSEDLTAILLIKDSIEQGKNKATDIYNHLKDHGYGKKSGKRLLRMYSQRNSTHPTFFTEQRGFQRNYLIYTIPETDKFNQYIPKEIDN